MTRQTAPRMTDPRNEHPEPAHRGVYRLCLLPVSCRLRGRQAGLAGQESMAAVAADLHPVSFDLLHRLDVLWRRWIRGAQWVRIPDDLSWSDAGHGQLVVAVAQDAPYWQNAKNHVDRRPHFIPLRKIQPSGRRGDDPRRDRNHPLYRLAATIGDTVVLGFCRRSRRVKSGRLPRSGALAVTWVGRVHRPVRDAQP